MELLLPCALGIESVIRTELRELGYRDTRMRNGQVFLSGNWQDVLRLNRSLRTAERVLILLGRFHSTNFDELFDAIVDADLGGIIPQDAVFPVTARARRPGFGSDVALQRTVKKAVVKNLFRTFSTETLPESGAHYPLHLVADREEIILGVDTTGIALHKRGYREETGGAPLKETLAATLLFLAEWDRTTPLHDPCCGSGTIPIEAALLASQVQPGENRSFLFEEWEVFRRWQGTNLPTNDVPKITTLPLITGADQDNGMITVARENAVRAGVSDALQFSTIPVAENRTSGTILVSNPPYGERLKTELFPLYRAFRRLLEQNRELHLLTSDRTIEKGIGEPAERRRKLTNGGLEVTFYSWRNT